MPREKAISIGWFRAFLTGALCMLCTSRSQSIEPCVLDNSFRACWSKGQEWVYQGSIDEESMGRGVRFHRQYRLENHFLILNTDAQGATRAVIQTRLQQISAQGGTDASSTRLEISQITNEGFFETKPSPTFDSEVEGPEALETGFLIGLPAQPWREGQTWSWTPNSEPRLTATIVGFESLHGTQCVKIQFSQQSPEWTKPRGDRHGWQTTTNLWVHQTKGYTQKVERVHERRHAAHREITYRMITRYELTSDLVYEGSLLKDREREIEQAIFSSEQIRLAMQQPDKRNLALLDAVIKRIDSYMKEFPATPYREALVSVKRRALACSKQQWVPPVQMLNQDKANRVGLAISQPAPEFICPDITEKRTISLHAFKGQFVLMAFMQSQSSTLGEILPFLEKMQQSGKQDISNEQHAEAPSKGCQIIGVAFKSNKEDWESLQVKHNLTFPILLSMSLPVAYQVSSTPHWVLIDPDGLVINEWTGWGTEIPHAIQKALAK